jgi:hypothetical protein
MILGSQGAYYFNFSLGDAGGNNVLNDFIDEGNLVSFKIVERAGNILPVFELVFDTHDSNLPAFLNEGNILIVSLGRDQDNSYDVHFTISRVTKTMKGEGLRGYYINGTMAPISYLSTPNILITDPLTGLEVLKQISLNSFDDFVTNLDSGVSDDLPMRWIQYNISDKRFLNDVWMHTWLQDSFLGLGISTYENFIVKDIRKLAGQDPDFKFGIVGEEDPTVVLVDPDYVIDKQTGFINAWLGRGRQRLVYSLEDELDITVDEDPASYLALTDKLDRLSTTKPRVGENTIQTQNCHPNYWQAYERNLGGLATLSNVLFKCTARNQFFPIEVLDLIMFKDVDSVDNTASDHYSGLYVVATVARELLGRNLTTIVEAYRESTNELIGDLR